MAFAGNTRCLPYIRNFAQAHEHFIKTKPVHARKHTNIWTPDTRPLKNSGATHYRLRRGIDRTTGRLFFDLVLYSTTMARYHEPVEDNGYTVETRFYRWHSSQTSKGFMHDVAHMPWLSSMEDMNGNKCAVPIGSSGVPDPTDGEVFGAKLVLRNRMLSVPESDHQPLFRRVSTEDDRERVRQTRQRIEPLLDVVALRINTFEEDCEITREQGRAFGGKSRYHYNSMLLRRLTDLHIPVEEAFTSDAVENLFRYAQECYDVLASKRSVAMTNAQSIDSYRWRSSRPATDDPTALDRPITAAELRQVVANNLLREFHVAQHSGRIALPKFMAYDEFPRSNRFYY